MITKQIISPVFFYFVQCIYQLFYKLKKKMKSTKSFLRINRKETDTMSDVMKAAVLTGFRGPNVLH